MYAGKRNYVFSRTLEHIPDIGPDGPRISTSGPGPPAAPAARAVGAEKVVRAPSRSTRPSKQLRLQRPTHPQRSSLRKILLVF